MKRDLPALCIHLAVPVLCLALLAAAWAFMRGGGEPETPSEPVLRLLCDESLQAPLAGVFAAYERRGGAPVEADFVPLSGMAERLAGGADADLVLLGAAGAAGAPEWIGKEPFVEVAAIGALRAGLPGRREPSGPASDFLEFLSGPFAANLLGGRVAGSR